jgi:hypothetical protein
MPIAISVEQLLSEDSGQLDRKIAADLAVELKAYLSEKPDTIPELRRVLAIKGYRALRERLETHVGSALGDEAVRLMASAMRAFAHERPGLAAATFRNATIDTSEWRHEAELIVRFAIGVFVRDGLKSDQAANALKILRVLVRGFVLHEMTSSFLDEVDYDELYALTIEVYIRGLEALRC